MFFTASITSGLSTALLQWTGVIALVLVGVFAVIGIFDKATQGKKEQADKLDDRLINLLKQEVEALTRKDTERQAALDEMSKKLEVQSAENKTLKDIILQRDQDGQRFQNEIHDSMDRTKRILDLTESQQETLERMTSLFEALMSSQGVDFKKDSQKMPSRRKVSKQA